MTARGKELRGSSQSRIGRVTLDYNVRNAKYGDAIPRSRVAAAQARARRGLFGRGRTRRSRSACYAARCVYFYFAFVDTMSRGIGADVDGVGL